ncbi:MAG TPA: SMI1/KNR4 family protein [Gemmataceae bacterium]|nr:SMI1/KNR4 family protein [Gemmataceae bacterium]
MDELIDQLRENGEQVWIAGPQPEQAIVSLEHALGVSLPPSYRQFLTKFGAFKLLNSSVAGIVGGNPLAKVAGSLYGDTQQYRQDCGLPKHLLVIQPDEDAPYCLDTRKLGRDGEMPVVCYEPDSGYIDRMASSFGEWFMDYLQLQVDEDA